MEWGDYVSVAEDSQGHCNPFLSKLASQAVSRQSLIFFLHKKISPLQGSTFKMSASHFKFKKSIGTQSGPPGSLSLKLLQRILPNDWITVRRVCDATFMVGTLFDYPE